MDLHRLLASLETIDPFGMIFLDEDTVLWAILGFQYTEGGRAKATHWKRALICKNK